MGKRKLTYQFHNPNSPVAAADYITKVFIEANMKKVETVVKKNSLMFDTKAMVESGHSE